MYEYAGLQDYSVIYGGGNSKVYNTDLIFLMVEDENNDKFIDEALNKFVNYVSNQTHLKEPTNRSPCDPGMFCGTQGLQKPSCPCDTGLKK